MRKVAKGSNGRNRFSPNEWLEIVSLAENGASIQKIAETFKCHPSVIYRGLKKKGVQLGSNAQKASEEVARLERETLISRIKETKDNNFKWVSALQARVVQTVIQAERAGKPLGMVKDDIKALKDAIDAVGSGQKTIWNILNIDKENADLDRVLPELPIRELTEQEVEQIRDRQAMEAMEMDILGGDLDEEDDIEGDLPDEEEEGIVEEDEAQF